MSDDDKPAVPGEVTTVWSKVSGPGAVEFDDAAELHTTATFSAAGAYVLRLVADDGEVKTFDDLSVTAALPAVSITATDPTATEQGLTTGALTVARTGSPDAPLTVRFNVGGTATAGADFADPGASVTIPIGQSSALVTVTPLADTLAEGSETVVFTLAADAAYTVGTAASATVSIADQPADDWRRQKFGANAGNPAIAGDAADPDGDGASNLLEYTTGGDPLLNVPLPLTMTRTGSEIALTYPRADAATDVQCAAEWSADLATWSTAGILDTMLTDNGTVQTRRATVNVALATNAYIRLRVVRP